MGGSSIIIYMEQTVKNTLAESVRACQNCKNQFTIESEDFQFYEKIKVPPPTFCPECRLQRRLAWINSRTLYSRSVDGKSAISMYAPDKKYNIVEDKKWWNDTFDLINFGQEYNFNVPFFQQFDALLKRVPLPHLQRNYPTFENSDYCNAASYLKNCYLVFGADRSENVSYSNGVVEVRDSTDITFSYKSELCYECLVTEQCYHCFFCQDVENSSDMIFSQDCIGCNNCVGCFGLRNKSYHIFNQPYLKEEYKRKVEEFSIGSFEALEKLRNQAEEFFILQPHKFMHGRSNSDVSGDYIYHSKNVHHGAKVHHAENCKYVFILDYFTGGTANSYDYSWFGNNAELMYDTAWCGLGVSNIRFSVWNYDAMDLQYCYGCHNSQHLFGCVGLRNKKYCIFNKQYTKEEHEALVFKIIEHMNAMPYQDKKGRVYRYGEFLPVELSPFNYNETMAHEFVPQTRKQLEEIGYSWGDRTERNLTAQMSYKDLPDHINDVPNDLVGKLILCRAFEEDENSALEHNCTKVFKMTPQELSFYRRLGLPLPRLCPNSRYYQRLKQWNILKLWHRICTCSGEKSDNGVYQNTTKHFHDTEHCPNEFETSYAPDRPEIVYCESCYNAEVV